MLNVRPVWKGSTRGLGLAMAVAAMCGATARADRFTWTIDPASTITTKLTATYGIFTASDSKTTGVAGTFGGVVALPAYDFESVLFDQADVGFTSNPTFNLSFGTFVGGATITTNGLGFAIPGPNGKSTVPTTPSPVSLSGAFTQTGTGVEGRGTMTYTGYGVAAGAIGTGTINLVDLSPIPGDLSGTLTQVGNQIKLSTPLALDQTTTLDNGVTVRAQISGTVTGTTTTTAGGWKLDANGTMNTAANWSSGQAPAVDTTIDTVVLGNVITAPRTLTSPNAVRRLVISSAVPYTIDARFPLKASASGLPAQLDVLKGTGHTINSLALASATTFNIATGAAISTTFANGPSVTLRGGGIWNATNGTLDSLSIEQGVMRLHTSTFNLDGTGASVLNIAAGGQLDVADGGLAIITAPASLDARLVELRGEIHDGYAGGEWNGPGVVSSLIAGNKSLAVGFATSPTFGGNVQILAKATLLGDSNLDKAVDFTDLLALAKTYGQAGYWFNGDFDYSGTVDFNDLLSLAKNYNQTLSAAEAAELSPGVAGDFALAQSLVPEPTVLAAGGFALLGLARRRGRR